MDHELGVAINLDGLYPHFLGEADPHEQCLVLSLVVGGSEPKSDYDPEWVPLWTFEQKPSSYPLLI